jgi:hypothetical protein
MSKEKKTVLGKVSGSLPIASGDICDCSVDEKES